MAMLKPFQIFVQSPELQIATRPVVLEDPNPNFNLHQLKSSLFPKISDSLFFTINGKPLPDSTPLVGNPLLAPLSTLTIHLRIRGGGGDGGATGAESRDCYLNMYADRKPDKVDPNELRLSKWVNCSLSNEPLRRPVVIDKLGNLFNQEALVEALLKKTLPREFGYIKGLKDMIPVELSEVPRGGDSAVKFQCPITGLEFNGKYKFFAIKGCGHVLSAKCFKEVKSPTCLVCHREFVDTDKVVINGTEDEVQVLWDKLMEEKAKVKENGKKSKRSGKEVVVRVAGTKHGLEENRGGAKSNGDGTGKKLKAANAIPANATKEVYASIFISSKKSDFKETYSCRSLPLGRN